MNEPPIGYNGWYICQSPKCGKVFRTFFAREGVQWWAEYALNADKLTPMQPLLQWQYIDAEYDCKLVSMTQVLTDGIVATHRIRNNEMLYIFVVRFRSEKEDVTISTTASNIVHAIHKVLTNFNSETQDLIYDITVKEKIEFVD